MFNIAQVKQKGNTEISETGMSEVIRILQENGRLHDLIAAEILQGTNEKALDILRACDCRVIVPGTHFSPLNNLAYFYNCNPRYILTLLNRVGITPAKTPSDVMKVGFPHFMWENKLEKRFAIHRQYSNYTMIDRVTGEQYEFNHSSKAGNLYSARVVLAVSLLMYFGRTINPEAKGNDIYHRLMNSTYADNARRIFAEREKQRAEASFAAEVSQPEAPVSATEDAAVLSDGKITMSAGFMAGLIKTAVQEAITEFAKTSVPITPVPQTPAPSVPSQRNKHTSGVIFNSAGFPMRYSKPANWDEVMRRCDTGEISQRQGALLTGMSITTFSKYRKGLGEFYKS